MGRGGHIGARHDEDESRKIFGPPPEEMIRFTEEEEAIISGALVFTLEAVTGKLVSVKYVLGNGQSVTLVNPGLLERIQGDPAFQELIADLFPDRNQAQGQN